MTLIIETVNIVSIRIPTFIYQRYMDNELSRPYPRENESGIH